MAEKQEKVDPPQGAGASRLKFRVWDGREMYDLIELNARHQTVRVGFLGNPEWGSRPRPLPGVHVMQFTGLQDKNGRDIYEGDLVRHPTDGVFQIMWHLDRLEAVKERPSLPDCRPLYSVSNIVEIVGNIYEAPELVK